MCLRANKAVDLPQANRDVVLSAQHGRITGRLVSSQSAGVKCHCSECVLNIFAICHLVRKVACSVL